MNRREFIKTLSFVIVGASILPKISFGKERYKVKLLYETNLPFKEDVRLWNPIPYDTDYQKLIKMDVKTTGKYMINKDKVYGAPILYVEFKKNDEKQLKVTFEVEFTERSVDINKLPKDNTTIPSDVALFLKPTEHIPTDWIVKEYAEKITEGKKTQLEKVQAIYDWVVENTYRDPKVKGCGPGDVRRMLETKNFGGKCTDINSLFVALCRAIGVPAREVFGLRVKPSFLSKGISSVTKDATKAQHCRAEFYLGQWVPADPADVRKLILEENLTLDHPKVKLIREYLFGNWDAHWIVFNHARDFQLEPPLKSIKSINEFMYPIVEVGGELWDKLDLTFEKSKYTVLELV